MKCSKNHAGNKFYTRETKVLSSLIAQTYNNASTEMILSQINKIKSSLWSNMKYKDTVTKGGCQSLWRYTTRMAGGKTSLHTKWQKHQRIKKKKKKLHSQGSQPHDALLSWKTRIMVLLTAKMFVLTSYYTFFCSCKQESRVLMRLGEGIHLNPKEK